MFNPLCRVVRAAGKVIDYVLDSNGERSKLYDALVQHIDGLSEAEKARLTEVFSPWIDSNKLRNNSSKELAFGIYERMRSPNGIDHFGDWDAKKTGIEPHIDNVKELFKIASEASISSTKPISNIAIRGSKFTSDQHNPPFGNSGHYNGTYFYIGENAEKNALQQGDNLTKLDINNANLYTISTPEALKQEAKEAGYDVRDASGYAESDYLKSKGYDGIKQGNEVILFNPEKFQETSNNTKIEQPVYVKDKAALANVITKFFGVNKEQAKATAQLFEQMAQAWAKRNPTKNPADFYKEIGFGDKELFDQLEKHNTGNDLVFSKEQQLKLKTEKETLKKTLTYPGKEKTLLNENDWFTVRTATFKDFFGDWENDKENASKVLDKNGEPMVQYHWSKATDIEKFNLAGMGSHFGTEQTAKEVVNFKNNEGSMSLYDEETGETVHYTPKAEEGKFYKVFLNLRNPLEMEDIGQHNVDYYIDSIKKAFKDQGITLTEKDINTLKSAQKNTDQEIKVVYDLLNKHGFDGFKYKNIVESKGDTSYIAITQNSIKSVDSVGFDKVNPNIYKQADQTKIRSDIEYLKTYHDLVSKFDASTKMFTGFTKDGVGAEKLAKILNADIKAKNLDVEAFVQPTVGRVFIRPKDILNQEAKGAFNTVTRIMYGLTNPDVTTFPHELAHAWEQTLTDEERNKILDWTGHKTWERNTSEAFAKGFEEYLKEGNKTKDKELNNIFAKFAKWLADTYIGLKQAFGLELNDTMRNIYANMLNSEHVPEEIKAELEEALPKTEEPTKDYHIVGEDGQIAIYNSDNNLITNPDSEYGAFDTYEEAQAYIDKLKQQDTQEAKQEPISVEQPPVEEQPITEEPKVEEPVQEKEKPQVSIEQPIEEPKPEQERTFLDRKGVTLSEDKNKTKKQQGNKVFDVKNNATGEVLGSIVEDVEETHDTPENYQITGDERNGFNITDKTTNRYIKVPELNEKGKATGKDIPIEFNTEDEAREHINKLVKENSTSESNGWFDVDTKDQYNTKEDAVNALLDKYNEQHGLSRSAEKAPETYYKINVRTGKKGTMSVVARLTKPSENGVYTLEDKLGNTYERINPTEEATENDFNKQDLTNLEQKATKPKYKIGQNVVDKDGNTHTITDIEVKPTVNKSGEAFKDEITYTTDRGILGEDQVESKAAKTPLQTKIEKEEDKIGRVGKLKRIAAKFEKLFPQIKHDIRDMNIYDEKGDFVKYPFEAPARFKDGVVEINTGYNDRRYTRSEIAAETDPFNVPWLKRETVAHEYMHPFVQALKESNSELYNSLLKELKDNHKDVIDHVDRLVKRGDYEAKSADDEALTIYLGKELTKAFDKTGHIDKEYMKDRTLVQKFVDWLHDIMNFLTGKRKPKTLEQFVDDANVDKDKQKDDLKNILGDADPLLKDLFKKTEGRLTAKITILEKNKDGVRKALNNDELYHEIYSRLDSYKHGGFADSRFTFAVRENAQHSVEIDETDPDNVKVFIDPKAVNSNNLAHTLLEFGKKIKDNDVAKEFKDLVTRNVTTDTKNAKTNKEKSITIDRLNPLMKLGDVTDFLLFQMDDSQTERINELYNKGRKEELTISERNELKDLTQKQKAQGLQIKYTPQEMDGIAEMEAYMDLNKDTAEKSRKNILRTMPLLEKKAKDLGSDTLQREKNILRNIDLDYKDDVDFVMHYTQQASTGINMAYRKYAEIVSDVIERQRQRKRVQELEAKGVLTADEQQELDSSKAAINNKAELSRLNKELNAVRQLVGFYENFSKYSNFEDNFMDKDAIRFRKSMSYIEKIRQGMADAAVNLTVEWLLPYGEQHNKYMKEKGYTDEKYLLTPELLRNHLKYGVGEDTNYITYWLGANITSRNPINATFMNTVGDAISFNNIDTDVDTSRVDDAFRKWIKEKGFSNLTDKDQVKFFEEKYLRKASVLYHDYESGNNKYTGEHQDVYVDKLAFHQPYYFDKYEKDLTVERKKYENPRDSKEAELFDEQLQAWKEKYNYGEHEKYRNKDYEKLKDDVFFKTLEKYYNESNERYGDNRLHFGVIPQQYSSDAIKKFKEIVKEVSVDKKIADKYQVVKEKMRNAFGGINEKTEQDNLDGTVTKTLNTKLTTIKDDVHVNKHLPESIINFITESRHHETLKATQHNVETLMMVLQGSTKWDIKPRAFASEDFTRKYIDKNQWERAKAKRKELDEKRADGEAIDEELYKKIDLRVKQGVKRSFIKDKLLGFLKKANTNYNNESLIAAVNNIYYGEGQKITNIKTPFGEFSMNKLANDVGFYTSVVNMAGNLIAAVNNVGTGNLQLLIEAHGGNYFKKKHLGLATADYAKNIPNYIKDLSTAIKSKDTQLSITLDAIQGEVHDSHGFRIVGNIARKMFTTNNLFLLTKAGEHQIQITGMKAMMLGKEIMTNAGEKINLYDAYVANKEGRYELRKDIKFGADDLAKFTRDLHGVNRMLNGNYSDANKTMLQYQWYGNLAIKFRKYLYPSFRARWASEHVDYERNTVEVGYLNYFFMKYIPQGIKQLVQGKTEGFNTKTLQPHEQYAVRKALMETGVYLSMTFAAMALAGTGTGKNKKDLSDSERVALLLIMRLHNDYGMYNGDVPDILAGQVPIPWSEAQRNFQSPTASLQSLMAFTNIVKHLQHPSARYAQAGYGHDKGDNEVWSAFKKVIPGRQPMELMTGQFMEDVNNKLGYFNNINTNVTGVSPKQNAQ